VPSQLSRRAFLVDSIFALVFTVSVVGITHRLANHNDRSVDGLATALLIVAGGSLAFRRRAPLATLVASVAALVVYTLRDYPGGPVYLAVLVALYTLASLRERREVVVPTVLALAALLVAGAISSNGAETIWFHAAFIGWTAAAVFIGDAARTRRAYLAGLEQRARYLEESREEEARRRVADERVRIARDLHDVIAHAIATIHIQSGVAAHVLDRHPEQARPALLAIKQVSKETMAELRATLDLLREGEESAPLAPLAGLDRLDALVETTRQAGVPVELRVTGDPRPLAAAVDVAAYRIVQESLTNVMRHSGATKASVAVVHEGDHVDVEVVDDGRGASARGEPGHGIAGMRERAAMVGGTLEAGPRPGGGFRVHTRLPRVGAAV
jgi:signal transduction histidine kinase